MTLSQAPHSLGRAVVLGGGGVTGISWEIGVLAALHQAGVDVHAAQAVFGTSAGAFVGAALASGSDLNRLYAAQLIQSETEVPATASSETMDAWSGAFMTGGSDPERVGAAMGAVARAHPEPVPAAERRRAVEGRLVTSEWPGTLRITAINADSGALHVFGPSSGVSLIDAVSASGAVPGVWPLVRIGAHSYIDGGMVSATNTRLANGYGRVLVLAPLPEGYGAIPGATEEVQAMSAAAAVLLISPDDESRADIGPNIYDPRRRGLAAEAGWRQGAALAATVLAFW